MHRPLMILGTLVVAASCMAGCARHRDYDRHYYGSREVVVYPETERVVRYREEPHYYHDRDRWDYDDHYYDRHDRVWIRRDRY